MDGGQIVCLITPFDSHSETEGVGRIVELSVAGGRGGLPAECSYG